MRIAAAFLFVHTVLAPTVSNAALPTLRVQGDDGNVALALRVLKVRVTVHGHLARTEFELTYRNTLERDTEGEFEFPLPADAEVSDVGLYFDDHLRHAVAVERTLARTAYDEIKHAGVDPALVEWSAGRSFKLRVYPIPANGEKKVFIAYDQELTSGDYELDVRYGRSLSKFDLQVDAEGREQIIDGVVRVPRATSETALSAQVDGQWYASAAIDLKGTNAEMPRAPHVVILCDTSSSSVQQNAAALRKFLELFLARQNAAVDLIPFHVRVEPAQRIGGAFDVGRALSSLQPLGATNLTAVAGELPRIAAGLPLTSRIVLITDGLTSLGDSREVSAAFAGLANLRRPLTVVNAAPSADAHLLSNTAHATGGWWIDLSQSDPETAAANAMRTPVRLRLPDPLLPDALVSIGDGRYAVAARSRQMLATLRIGEGRELPLRELIDGKGADMVRRAWARAQLRAMLARNAPDDELIEHGRAFTQLTPRTSLIVLDSWRDYERYGIPMPPEVQAEKEKFFADHAQWQHQRTLPVPPSKVVPGGWFLSGRVLDASGVPLPGVTVVLLDDNAPVVADVTDAEGHYVLGTAGAPQKPGIRAELAGFNTIYRPFAEAVPSGSSYDVTMHIAAVTETITVTAAARPGTEEAEANTSSPAASLRTKIVTSDDLLNAIAGGEVPDAADVAAHRRELTRAVVDRLRGINSTSERVRYYLSARALLGGDKGFHVFAAEVFREKSPDVAARVLSDLAEARPDDAPLLRILARVLDGWGENALARLLLQRAIAISPTEPQSWREMILAEARRGGSVGSWSKRMFAAKHREWADEVYQQTSAAVQRWERAGALDRMRGIDLRADPENDITIELMFDSGWCYVDLHVTEPSGEEVTWNQTTSAAGATFTGGYILGFGPEIYTLPKAPRGTYKLSIDYWSVDDTEVSLEALVHVVVYQRGRRGGIERRDHFLVLGFEDEDQELPPVVVD